jgi:hypothetical protein
VSSILDALQKVEAAEPPGIHARPAPRDERSRRPLRLVALVLAFGAGVALSFWVLARGDRPAGPVAPAERPPEVAVAAAPPSPPVETAKPPAAAASPPQPAPAPHAAPPETAAVASPAAPPPPIAVRPQPVPPAEAVSPPQAATPPVATPPLAAATALPLVAPAPLPQPSDGAPVGRIAHDTAPPAPAPPAAPVPAFAVPRPPAGAPRVQVSFLVYSRAPERRTVALTIDGGGMVTLREGESTSGVEVTRIHPDRVELRHAGRDYTITPRD